MIWKPYEHVLPLLDAQIITEAQWYLFAIAADYLESPSRVSNSVMLQVGGVKIQAFKIGLDVQLPGILCITSAGSQRVYAQWSDLKLVTASEG